MSKIAGFSTLTLLSDTEIYAVAGGRSIYQSANGGSAVGIGANGGSGGTGRDSGGRGGSVSATGGNGGSNSIGPDQIARSF